MFGAYIETKWRQKKVRVGLPARGHGDEVTIEATGFTSFVAALLSDREKRQLAKLAKDDAISVLKYGK